MRIHVADDDTIVTGLDLLGANTGELLGMAPTGLAFRAAVIEAFTAVDMA